MTSPLIAPGTTIGLISPASQASVHLPLRLELGRRWLRARGYVTELMPAAASSDPWPTSKERADDLHQAFTDPQIAGVCATIGGNSAITVVPHLDRPILADNVKLIHGGSDITSLLWWLHYEVDAPAVYGPMVAMGMAEQPQVYDVTRRGVEAAWSGGPYSCFPSDVWTEERVDIGAGLDLTPSSQERQVSNVAGWRVLRPGVAQGRVLAGCLEVLGWWVRGTNAWKLFDRGPIILVLDIALSGSRWGVHGLGGPHGVATHLQVLGHEGSWHGVRGLVVSRPRGYTPQERLLLDDVVRRYVPDNIPIVMDFDFGHTEPSWSLPLGAACELDTDSQTLHIQ